MIDHLFLYCPITLGFIFYFLFFFIDINQNGTTDYFGVME